MAASDPEEEVAMVGEGRGDEGETGRTETARVDMY